jgi:multiple sugar transport system substrate-binding protein
MRSAMKVALALLAVSLSLVAAGCGGGGSSSKSSGDFAPLSSSERSGQTLRIYGFGPGDDVATNRTNYAKQQIAPAKVLNPAGAFDPQRFLTQLASGSVADVIYLDRQQVATLAAKGALQPLDGCVDQQSVPKSQYNQAALAEGSYGGQLYALPEFTNQRTLIVNTDIVPAAQAQTSNWDQLRATAKQAAVVQGGKVSRVGFDPKIPEFFIMWAHANGVELMSADGKSVHFDDPKTVQALEFTKSLIDEQGGWNAFKSFRDTWDFFGANNQVAKKQVGFWPMESWYWNVMASTSPQVHVAAVPFTDRNGKEFTYISGSGWAIPKGAKNPSLACAWMKAITSVPSWMAAAQKRAASAAKSGQPFTGLYTANNAADQKILNTVYKPQSKQWDDAVKTLVAVQKDAIYWPSSPAGQKVQQALTDAINRVLAGQQTPKAALAQAQQEAEAALKSS